MEFLLAGGAINSICLGLRDCFFLAWLPTSVDSRLRRGAWLSVYLCIGSLKFRIMSSGGTLQVCSIC